MGKAGKIVRLVRVMRIMRIFKLVRHFAGLQSLIYTLNQAYKELGLLMLLVGVAVLTFSSLVYFAEKDNPKGSWSFLDSFWWGLMTLTTVGYGDLSPSTFPGKLIGKISRETEYTMMAHLTENNECNSYSTHIHVGNSSDEDFICCVDSKEIERYEW